MKTQEKHTLHNLDTLFEERRKNSMRRLPCQVRAANFWENVQKGAEAVQGVQERRKTRSYWHPRDFVTGGTDEHENDDE